MYALEVLADCHKCELRGEDEPVPPKGPVEAQLVIIGEHPAGDEGLVSRPFDDRAGLLLKKVLRTAGLKHEDCWLTYAVKCHPNGQGACWRASATCKGWLWEELRYLQPKVVVTMGNVPTRLLLQLKASFKMADIVGHPHGVSYLPGVTVIPSYSHRLLVERGRIFENELVSLFAKVKESITC